MAGVIKVNPQVAPQNWEQTGKKVTWFEVSVTKLNTYNPSDAAAPTDAEREGYEADGALNAILAVIQLTTTIIALGGVTGSGGTTGVFSVAVEGEFSDAALNSATDNMQASIRALGVVIGSKNDGTDNGLGFDQVGAVVTPKTFVLA